MGYWLVKTEPSTYSFGDLEKARRAVWDGVANPTAVRNIRAAKKGDLVVVYHTGGEKAAIGIAEVVAPPYDDPKDARLAVFELAPRKRLAQPVPLSAIKASAAFAASPLVTQGRLSVVRLDAAQWKQLLALARTSV
jgi:predicted RNA-binding protein with PUA-like domain